MTIKCKMCGGDMNPAENTSTCECEHCGTMQTIPNADNEKKCELFNRANSLRMNNEFDKASAVYKSIIAEFPKEAEAYWGLCLCEYGVEYITDSTSGKKIPICHHTLSTSIMEDTNFEHACDNADAVSRNMYREEAKHIEHIQKDARAATADESSTSSEVSRLMKQAYQSMEDGNFSRANEYLDRVLDIDPNYSAAHEAKTCVTVKLCNEKEHSRKLESKAKKKRNVTIAVLAVLAVAIALLTIKVIIPNYHHKEQLEQQFVVGNYVELGTYPQTSSGTDSTPIEWLVLARDGDNALLISRYSLDAQPYNEELEDTTWEKCTLRTWLNTDFYNKAFSADDKQHIIKSRVTADQNPSYSTDPGNDTTDNVFLLSIDEVNKYFAGDTERICYPTDYAKERGAYTSNSGACWWWLRSPGFFSDYAALVNRDGSVINHGCSVRNSSSSVRPAVWVRLF